MKKLFVSLMAIAALVSCSKEEDQGIALDSKNKTVEITIKNASQASRVAGAITDPGVADEGQTNKMASADAGDLWVLFAAGDDVLAAKKLTATGTTDITHDGVSSEYVADSQNGEGEGTYIWHNVPWQVTNIAVVRTDATLDADFYGTAGEGKKTLTNYNDRAKSEEANLTRGLDKIVLYGTGALTDMNITHEVDGVSYHYWKADVEVKPWVARFEVNQIKCKDLGTLNVDGINTTYGFDELLAKKLTWTSTAGTSYTAAYEGENTTLGTMYGVYKTPEGGVNYIKPADGKVWSWNVADKVTFNQMVVDLEATAYDYSLTEDGKNVPLVVVGLNGTPGTYQFDAGNIYQLDLTFEEGNVKDQDALCVQVNVTIAKWTINVLTPAFQTNPAK